MFLVALGVVVSAITLWFFVFRRPSEPKKPLNLQIEPLSSEIPRTTLTGLIGVSDKMISIVVNNELVYYSMAQTNVPEAPVLIAKTVVDSIRSTNAKQKNYAFLETCSCSDKVLEKAAELLKKHDIEARVKAKFDTNDLLLTVRYRRCFQCDRVINDKKPAQCSACKTVIYCSPECSKVAWKKHKMQCQVLKVCTANMAELGLHNFPFDWYTKDKLLHDFDLPAVLVNLNGLYKSLQSGLAIGQVFLEQYNTDLEAAYKNYGFPPLKFKTRDFSDWKSCYESLGLEMDDFLALLLHYPLTMWHMIKNTQPNDNKSVTIHVIGAEHEVDAAPLFSVLTYLLDKDVTVKFYGPVVPKADPIEIRQYGHVLKLEFHNGLYPTNAENADYYFALNANFLVDHEHWAQAVNAIKQKQATLLCTEVYEVTIDMVQKTGLPIVKKRPNPFKMPLAITREDWNLMGWVNGWLFEV